MAREQLIGAVRESIVQAGGVFGILSAPVDGGTGAPVILLSNAGTAHHVGPSRLYVLLARELARAGFRCLRFDLPGLGDSVIDDPARENDAYPPNATEVVEALMRALPAPAHIAMGLCAGAHTSFHAALKLPLVESVLLNPLTFHYEPGLSLEQPSQLSEWNRYMQSARRLDRWAKLFRGEVRVRALLKTVLFRIRDVVRRKLSFRPHRLERDVRGIIEAGRQLTFVFARFDPGYDLLMAGAGRAVKQFRKSGKIALWQIEGASHTFESKASREVMIRSLVEHLARRYLGSAASSASSGRSPDR